MSMKDKNIRVVRLHVPSRMKRLIIDDDIDAINCIVKRFYNKEWCNGDR